MLLERTHIFANYHIQSQVNYCLHCGLLTVIIIERWRLIIGIPDLQTLHIYMNFCPSGFQKSYEEHQLQWFCDIIISNCFKAIQFLQNIMGPHPLTPSPPHMSFTVHLNQCLRLEGTWAVGAPHPPNHPVIRWHGALGQW